MLEPRRQPACPDRSEVAWRGAGEEVARGESFHRPTPPAGLQPNLPDAAPPLCDACPAAAPPPAARALEQKGTDNDRNEHGRSQRCDIDRRHPPHGAESLRGTCDWPVKELGQDALSMCVGACTSRSPLPHGVCRQMSALHCLRGAATRRPRQARRRRAWGQKGPACAPDRVPSQAHSGRRGPGSGAPERGCRAGVQDAPLAPGRRGRARGSRWRCTRPGPGRRAARRCAGAERARGAAPRPGRPRPRGS